LRGGELLSLVGLTGERHRIKGYSRGMKQRLGIASTLLTKPKLLIADEPTSALDPLGRREIIDILSSLRDETTVLFSTHILSDVERICTDVAFLDGGVNIISGRISEIKADYGTDEYLIEADNEEGARVIEAEFPGMKRGFGGTLEFSERDHSLHELMRFISEKRIAVSSIIKKEPSLESLFMEVAGK
jgi:ABC-2 type transport system ATP-binding protein